MSVPDSQTLMLPVLNACSGGETERVRIRDAVAAELGLSKTDLVEMLPSRRMTTFANRVAWALSYLSIAGLLERTRRGIYRLTTEGESVLRNPPERVDMKYLDRYPAYVAWRRGSRSQGSAPAAMPLVRKRNRPEHLRSLTTATIRNLPRALEGELLERVRKVDANDSRTSWRGRDRSRSRSRACGGLRARLEVRIDQMDDRMKRIGRRLDLVEVQSKASG